MGQSAPRECAALTTCWFARRTRSTVSPWPARHETKRQAAATAARRSAGCSKGGEMAERPRAGEWGRLLLPLPRGEAPGLLRLESNGRRERASMPTAERQAHAASWSSARGGEDEALRGSRARSAAEWAQGQHFSRHKERRVMAGGAECPRMTPAQRLCTSQAHSRGRQCGARPASTRAAAPPRLARNRVTGAGPVPLRRCGGIRTEGGRQSAAASAQVGVAARRTSPPGCCRPLHCRPSPPSPRCCRRALVQAARGGRHLARGLHAMPPSRGRAPRWVCGRRRSARRRHPQSKSAAAHTRQAGTRPRPAPRRLRAALRRCHRCRKPHRQRVTASAGRPIAAPSLHSSRAPLSPAHPHHTLSLTHSHTPHALPAHPPRTVLRLPPSSHAAARRNTTSDCA
jgi:hypothetical protein